MFDQQLPLTPYIKTKSPLQCWSIHLITELKLTNEGCKFLIVAVDCFTKWVEIWPMRTKSSVEVVIDCVSTSCYILASPIGCMWMPARNVRVCLLSCAQCMVSP